MCMLGGLAFFLEHRLSDTAALCMEPMMILRKLRYFDEITVSISYLAKDRGFAGLHPADIPPELTPGTHGIALFYPWSFTRWPRRHLFATSHVWRTATARICTRRNRWTPCICCIQQGTFNNSLLPSRSSMLSLDRAVMTLSQGCYMDDFLSGHLRDEVNEVLKKNNQCHVICSRTSLAAQTICLLSLVVPSPLSPCLFLLFSCNCVFLCDAVLVFLMILA